MASLGKNACQSSGPSGSTDDDDKSLDAELESHSGHASTISFSNNRQNKLPPNTPMFMANGHTCDDSFLKVNWMLVAFMRTDDFDCFK